MSLTDFLGVPFFEGDFIVKDGGGNSGKGYGMILYQVVGVRDKSISVRCLDVGYPNHSKKGMTISLSRKSSISSTKKVVIVEPTEWSQQMFRRCEENALTQKEKEQIGTWIHSGEEP